MPLESTEAIILKSSPWGELDKLVVFFSRDKGLLRGLAKGAQKFGNRFGSSLEPMSYVKVFYYEKERQDFVTISQCDLIESFFELQTNFQNACLLSYWAELTEEFYPTRIKEEFLFRLLLACLRALKAGGDREIITRYFEIWLLRLSGLLPEANRCQKCHRLLTSQAWLSPKKDGFFCESCTKEKNEPVPAELVSFIKWTRKYPPSEKAPLSSEASRQLAPFVQAWLIYHLEKEPRSLRLLKA
ncbi:MAG: DNA repair protein RecO [Candidatus Aminicenantes bacterium]|nr:DNA repair protein RecO [Candidatus Aminicenantes bacterium]